MAAKEKAYIHAVGRRKTSVARVYVAPGTGKVVVNNRNMKEYFKRATSHYVINQPMNLLKVSDRYDVNVTVAGGGDSAQAGAIRLGIARAIVKMDATSRSELRRAGFLTRDPRAVERKKYGRSGARKRFQFSKR